MMESKKENCFKLFRYGIPYSLALEYHNSQIPTLEQSGLSVVDEHKRANLRHLSIDIFFYNPMAI